MPPINFEFVNPLPKDAGLLTFFIIDISILIGIVLLIIKRKQVFTEVPEDVFDRETSKKIKGLLALLVVLHHLSLYIKNVILFKIFNPIGMIVVATFFFYSGYGLMTGYQQKKNYLDGFFRRRIVKILIPYLLVVLFTVLAYALTGNAITWKKLWNSFFDGNPAVKFSWYVIEIIVFYFLFWIAARLSKSIFVINLVIFIGTIVFCIVTTKTLSYGNWWISASFSFFIGINFASYREKYRYALQTRRKTVFTLLVTSALALVLLGLRFLFSGYPIKSLINMPEIADWILTRPISVVCLNILSLSMMVLLLLLMTRIHLNDKVFGFLGNISFEIYLYHGLIMYLLRNNYMYCRFDFLYAFFTIILSIIAATLMNYVDRSIVRGINKFSDQHLAHSSTK